MWLIAIKGFRNFICLLIAWNHNNQFYSSQKCKFHFERIMTAVLFFWKIKLWKSCKKLVFQASRAVTVLTINEWNTLKVMIETELNFISSHFRQLYNQPQKDPINQFPTLNYYSQIFWSRKFCQFEIYFEKIHLKKVYLILFDNSILFW